MPETRELGAISSSMHHTSPASPQDPKNSARFRRTANDDALVYIPQYFTDSASRLAVNGAGPHFDLFRFLG